jgi:2'-5' RNA ligase
MDVNLHDDITIGIVIVVPEPWAQEILDWRMGLGDPYSDRMPTHITLVAPAKLPRSRMDALLTELATAMSTQPQFEVTIGPVGSFRPVSPVVFLHARDRHDELARLEQRVRQLVTDQLPMHPFVPHVTIAMNVGEGLLDAAADALSDFTATWRVAEVVVYERDNQGYWSVVKSCELG